MTLPQMKIEYKMSVGNMIALAVLAFGVVQFWIQMDERQQQLVRYVERVEQANQAQLVQVIAEGRSREQRITSLEVQAAEFRANIRSIRDDTQDIRTMLRDMRAESRREMQNRDGDGG